MIADDMNKKSENPEVFFGLYDEPFTYIIEEAERRAALGFKTAQVKIEPNKFHPTPDYKIISIMLHKEGFDVRVFGDEHTGNKYFMLGWGSEDAPLPSGTYV